MTSRVEAVVAAPTWSGKADQGRAAVVAPRRKERRPRLRASPSRDLAAAAVLAVAWALALGFFLAGVAAPAARLHAASPQRAQAALAQVTPEAERSVP